MSVLTVLIVLPVYNEQEQLASSVERLREFVAGLAGYSWQIVIAENGSRDRTWPIALELAAKCDNVRAMHLDAAGRGGALKRVWLESDADILSYMDVDLSTDLNCFPPLIEAVASGRADLAVGSRLLPGSRVRRSWTREVLSRGYSFLLRAALHFPIRDAQCGFKALSRRAAQALLPQVADTGWFFDTELLFRAAHGGWRILEVPVTWVEDADTRLRLLPTILGDVKGVCRLRRERLKDEG